MMADSFPYKIYNSSGDLVMAATENARYRRKRELELLEAGYTIRLHGRKITKKELTGSAKGGT